MINLAGTPRILKRRKVLDQLLNRHRRPPFVDEGRTVTPRYTVKSHQPISCVAPACRVYHSRPPSAARCTLAQAGLSCVLSLPIKVPEPGLTHEAYLCLRSAGNLL